MKAGNPFFYKNFEQNTKKYSKKVFRGIDNTEI